MKLVGRAQRATLNGTPRYKPGRHWHFLRAVCDVVALKRGRHLLAISLSHDLTITSSHAPSCQAELLKSNASLQLQLAEAQVPHTCGVYDRWLQNGWCMLDGARGCTIHGACVYIGTIDGYIRVHDGPGHCVHHKNDGRLSHGVIGRGERWSNVNDGVKGGARMKSGVEGGAKTSSKPHPYLHLPHPSPVRESTAALQLRYLLILRRRPLIRLLLLLLLIHRIHVSGRIDSCALARCTALIRVRVRVRMRVRF